MPDASQLLMFVAAGWLLNLTPGPDVLYIVSHALRSGARAGIVAGFGVTAGCFVHIFGAALGVGALLATSATAFALLKWAGAAYLLYVGVKLLRTGATNGPLESHAIQEPPRGGLALRKVFGGGFWTNVLNPKVALFFLAFVPQFIAPHAEHPTWVFLALGTLFNVNAIPINIAWALLAANLVRRGAVVQRGLHLLDRTAGVLFIGFGLKLAMSDNPI